MWQRKAKPRVIGQNTGGGSGLLLCVREIKAEAAHAVQGVVCVLLHKGKHTAHGEVT
jgi:hypothetical protein